MKQGISLFSALVVLFMFVSYSSVANAESCILKARVTNVPPLYFQNESKQWTGLTVDLAKALLKEADCKADFEAVSWARSLDLMRTGGIDMMMNLSKTDERKEFIHFIGPQNKETAQLVLHKTDTTNIQSLDDFKKLPGEVGYQQGSFYGKAFHQKLKTDPDFNRKFEVSFSHENNIKKLKSGRITGLLSQNYSGVSAERDLLKSGDFKTHPLIINKNLVYFGFSKKSVPTEVLNRLEKAYQRSTTKQVFQRVIDSYK